MSSSSRVQPARGLPWRPRPVVGRKVLRRTWGGPRIADHARAQARRRRAAQVRPTAGARAREPLVEVAGPSVKRARRSGVRRRWLSTKDVESRPADFLRTNVEQRARARHAQSAGWPAAPGEGSRPADTALQKAR